MQHTKYKVDLHSHSIVSQDGGITAKQYQDILRKNILSAIAITDHNRIDFALFMHKKFGEQIIVGEEILTKEGEIIGLYLHKHIPQHQSVINTIQAIKNQKGLVYIPHPNDNRRHGITIETIKTITDSIDIIEVYNQRNLSSIYSLKTYFLSNLPDSISPAASSDAHSVWELGKTYVALTCKPNQQELKKQLIQGKIKCSPTPLLALLSPSFNRIAKRLSIINMPVDYD